MSILSLAGVIAGTVIAILGFVLMLRGNGNGSQLVIGPLTLKGGPGLVAIALGAVVAIAALVGPAFFRTGGSAEMALEAADDDDSAAPELDGDDSAEDDDSADVLP